jgi:YegS/Rv2252/BmrU family lipid kinase
MVYEKIFIIVNSRIGKTKIDALNKAMARCFPSQLQNIHYTEYGGHAKVLCQQAIDANFPLIVAVGGDGTINEVIQPLAHSQQALAVIPTGSGNGLARHLGIPLEIENAVAAIEKSEVLAIDLGKANNSYFISNAGVGFDAKVCNAIKQSKFRGFKMYLYEVIKHYFNYKSVKYTITIEGEIITEQAFFLNVANGSEFGYGFKVAPTANIQDALLDMILIKKINFWNAFGIVYDGFRGKLTSNKYVMHRTAKNFKIESDEMPFYQTDGDAHNNENNQCIISIFPKSLQILVPKKFSHE